MSLLPSQMPYGPAAFQDVHDFVMNQPTFVGSTAGDNCKSLSFRNYALD
jgi:hypothetical protein